MHHTLIISLNHIIFNLNYLKLTHFVVTYTIIFPLQNKEMDMYKRVAMWRLGLTQQDLELRQLSSEILLGKSVIGSDETSKEIERQIQNLQGKERARIERLNELIKNEALIAKRDGVSKKEHDRYVTEIRAAKASSKQDGINNSPQLLQRTKSFRRTQVNVKTDLQRYEDMILRCEQEVEIRERRLNAEREWNIKMQKEIQEADKRVTELLVRLQTENEAKTTTKAAKFRETMKKISEMKKDEEIAGIQIKKEQYEDLEKKSELSKQFFVNRAKSAVTKATAHMNQILNETHGGLLHPGTIIRRVSRPDPRPGLAEKVLEHQKRMQKFKYKPVSQIDYAKQAERLQKASDYIKNWKPPQKQESRSTTAIQIMMDYEMRMDKLKQIQDERKNNRRQWKLQVQQHQEKLESDLIQKQDQSFKQMQQFYTAKAANYEALKNQREQNRINLEHQTAARNEFLEGLRQQRELKREQLDAHDNKIEQFLNRREIMRLQTQQWINKIQAQENPEIRKQLIQKAREGLQKY